MVPFASFYEHIDSRFIVEAQDNADNSWSQELFEIRPTLHPKVVKDADRVGEKYCLENTHSNLQTQNPQALSFR